MDSNTLSLESIVRLRAEAFAHIRHHTAMILSIATGIESLDTALQQSIAERSIDESQSLVTTSCRLASLLNGEVE